MSISLAYGTRQRFRHYHGDLNIIGSTSAQLPVRAAEAQLNDGPWRSFYVESVPSGDVDWSYEYKASPARLRLPEAGEFNIEIPVTDGSLRRGGNRLLIRMVDAAGATHEAECYLEWDPSAPSFPIAVDVAGASSVQDIGQVVDGRFDLDAAAGVIRARAPASPDSLFLVGPPGRSQEALFDFRYFDGSRSKYVGLSDFFAGHRSTDESLGIKPLWATLGLATVRPRGEFAWEARAWISSGDLPGWRPGQTASAKPLVVRTDPPAYSPLEPRMWYRVRHRVMLDQQRCTAMFRIWAAGDDEPATWLCSETMEADWVAEAHASFGLFQHAGLPSEWRNIELRKIAR